MFESCKEFKESVSQHEKLRGRIEFSSLAGIFKSIELEMNKKYF